jgi:hypothetical protein
MFRFDVAEWSCSSLEDTGGRAETGKRRAGKKCKFGVLCDAGADNLEAVCPGALTAGHRAEATGVWAWEARTDAGGQTEWRNGRPGALHSSV